MSSLVTILLWFAAIGCGVMAGVYFAFSTFIMTAFGRVDSVHGRAAMNAINATILGSLFMPVLRYDAGRGDRSDPSVLHMSQLGMTAMLAAGLIYVIGRFACTAIFNVPMNNELTRAGADDALWARYLNDWTFWNHLRTIASTIASGLFIFALLRLVDN
jgi:uncharacterized membrane protein